MTPEQVMALLLVIADLRAGLQQVEADNARLTAENARLSQQSESA